MELSALASIGDWTTPHCQLFRLLFGSPMRFYKTKPKRIVSALRLGQHSAEILSEIAIPHKEADRKLGLSELDLSNCNMFPLPRDGVICSGGHVLFSPSFAKGDEHDHRRGIDGRHRDNHVHYYLCLGSAYFHVQHGPR